LFSQSKTSGLGQKAGSLKVSEAESHLLNLTESLEVNLGQKYRQKEKSSQICDTNYYRQHRKTQSVDHNLMLLGCTTKSLERAVKDARHDESSVMRSGQYVVAVTDTTCPAYILHLNQKNLRGAHHLDPVL